MKFKSDIQNFAKKDLREIVKWYNNQKKGLGNDFLSIVKKTILNLQDFPDLAQIRYFEIHTAILHTFPYLRHYYVDPDKKAIIIIGVYHTSRNPEIWEDRISSE